MNPLIDTYVLTQKYAFVEDGETVGVLCHSTEASESHIMGVANIGDKNVLKAKCKGSKFVSTEASKKLDLKKVTCSGNGFDPLVKVDAGMLTLNKTFI